MPGLALLESRISTDQIWPGTPGFSDFHRPGSPWGGAGLGSSEKAGWLSVPLHGWNGHSRSLVPSPGGVGTAVL